jgi:hypothetical protein
MGGSEVVSETWDGMSFCKEIGRRATQIKSPDPPWAQDPVLWGLGAAS